MRVRKQRESIVANSSDRMAVQTPNGLHSALDAWFAKCGARGVSFVPVFDPPVDPLEDYVVVYEARFEPQSLDRARVELWLTNDGYIALGLERRERVAKRLGIRTSRKGFAAGHEPVSVTQQAVLRLLDCVAAGEIAISAWVGVLGLRKTGAVASPEVCGALAEAGYEYLQWIHEVSDSPLGGVRFHAWNAE